MSSENASKARDSLDRSNELDAAGFWSRRRLSHYRQSRWKAAIVSAFAAGQKQRSLWWPGDLRRTFCRWMVRAFLSGNKLWAPSFRWRHLQSISGATCKNSAQLIFDAIRKVTAMEEVVQSIRPSLLLILKNGVFCWKETNEGWRLSVIWNTIDSAPESDLNAYVAYRTTCRSVQPTQKSVFYPSEQVPLAINHALWKSCVCLSARRRWINGRWRSFSSGKRHWLTYGNK